MRFGSSVVAYVGVIVAGLLLGRGSDAAALSWLVAVTFVLLVVSLRNSWDLLVSVGAATLEGQAQQPE
jgi:type IV secretory pathway VirB2 component (pilin)